MSSPLPQLMPSFGMALKPSQKAAVIVRMLEATGVRLPGDAFSPEERAEIDRQIAGLDGLDPGLLSRVIDEFLEIMSGSGPASGGPNNASSALPDLPAPGDGLVPLPAMSGGAAPEPDEKPEDIWQRVTAQDNDAILALLDAEAPEVGAVIMSRMKVSRAAELLGLLPGHRARRLAYAVSLIDGIRPETVHRIGESLAASFDDVPTRAFSEGPVERVGALLNFSRAATRNDVLSGLDETDPEFAEAVRRSIFTFANIPARIGPRDIPRIVRRVDQAVLVTALAASRGSAELEAAGEFVLGALSQRMAEAIRTEIAEREEVKPADGEAAMVAIVGVVREMEAEGEIYLIADEE